MTLVEHSAILTRISWTGVIAGLAVGVVTQLALSASGVAFGAAYANSAGNLASGTLTWLVVPLLISSALAGLTAARAAGHLTPAQGRFNGLITGMLLALLSTTVLSNASTAGFRAASGVLSGAASVADLEPICPNAVQLLTILPKWASTTNAFSLQPPLWVPVVVQGAPS